MEDLVEEDSAEDITITISILTTTHPTTMTEICSMIHHIDNSTTTLILIHSTIRQTIMMAILLIIQIYLERRSDFYTNCVIIAVLKDEGNLNEFNEPKYGLNKCPALC